MRHGSSDSYRYGFQGQEKDDELKGEGNSLNYTFRMHDPRVGRFFTIDPLTHKYPFYSPYHFSSNSPIMSVELEGLETSTLVNEKQKAIKEHGAVKTWLGLRILDFIEGFINVGRLTQGKPILKYPILQASSEENLGAVKSVYNTTFEVMSVWQTAKYGIGGENDEI
ncbi:RHS repeat-associated core domain-containing protein [Flavobacterium lipolyticum]